ncbi:porin [Trinickia symbiotica]|uniref:Porin n=1 Tax=Trinickia symbiotica TaxID=863227 RepID=A0A2T3XKW4_9BURK|nr:porin [Trinickia symbiotica]PTB17087.1 porin [Trinickia symbiotica]
MKSPTILLLTCIGLAAGAANAQSSVTLYGVIDTGLAYVNTVAPGLGRIGSRRYSMVTAEGTGDQWGLTGSEDLGGGLRAIFKLENGFSAIDGTLSQGGRLWGREAWIGMTSPRAGTLTLGRQYDMVFSYLAPLVAWSRFGTIYGSHIGAVDETWTLFRLNNSIKYQISPIDGLTVGALYAFSNQASGSDGTGFANNSANGLGAKYDRGGLQLRVAYLHLSNPSAGIATATNPGGAIGNEYSASTSIFFNAGFVRSQDTYAAGAGYTIGTVQLAFIFTNTLLDYKGGEGLRVANYEVNGTCYLTPAFMLGAGYIYTDGSGYGGTGATQFATGDKPRWHQVDLGASYLLSKRTDLHGSVIYQRAAGDASEAAINGIGPAGMGKRNQLVVVAGLRHRF